ncbi:PRC-barrel domain-containing protein [Falsigemmobacter faecalis]|uniref:PRC-barrel domain-containing protein n=1 Tax=Falsigemmobacter faecalis TaxID=2488730 RepID=A0A3P3DKU8_9RHOB|nr:PRC-barrel domain-containing protein [Falsigemmobacter faecalis]RRH74795.1 hypothetical protein EG244_09860 [Falsigemmobacter faecalis]
MNKTPIAALITTVALLAPPAFAQQGTAPDGAATTIPPGLPPHTAPTAPDGTSPTTSPTGQVDVQTKPDLGDTAPAPAQSADPGTPTAPSDTPAAPGAATTMPAAPGAATDTPAAPGAATTAPAAPVTPPAADTPAMATGLLAPEGYSQVSDFAVVTAEQLKGAELRSAEGKDIGKITELRTTAAGAPEALIADIGGFLGLGAHTVQLTPDQIGIFKNDSDSVIVVSSLTEDVLKSLPAWEAPAQ